MAKVIAFSGGCHSGKTTTINKVAKALKAKGYKVKILGELMREVSHTHIDELRKDANEYLRIQEQIISAKIDQECEAYRDVSETIYLVDRAITDSLFYLENYVDKSQLSDTGIDRLCNLDFVTREYAMDAFNKGYNMLIQFEPIDIVNNEDTFRPHDLDRLKDYEYQGISTLNRAYLWCRVDNYAELHDFFLEVNMNCNSVDFIVCEILNTIDK